MVKNTPNLYGLKYSNRNFNKKATWGKNQFNSSFPATLSLYLHSKGLENIYLKLDDKLNIKHSKISTNELMGIDCMSEDIFFSFETVYTPYQQLLIGSTPRVDLVILDRNTDSALKGIEIKLTAIPDNATCELSHDEFGCEIVMRPDTIVYLACSIAKIYQNNIDKLNAFFSTDFKAIDDWSEIADVLPYVTKILKVINDICLNNLDNQSPLVMQPIWKTDGKLHKLSDNCLDVFVWSNLAFIQVFTKEISESKQPSKITRQIRSLIWLFKMLFDFSENGQIDHKSIIDKLTYNTKNDKAFSVNGSVTHPFMKCDELSCPRIAQSEIKNIILGGGQLMLSPERRLDAILYNSPELF